ncbi:hypothetical protein [Cohnella caldifontis]|uniref:hypothetical protein n=1 Tax=Cohnella caldifontis TaxID=3027471 RepID=UPI0023EB22FD|nr:hypothetical protein [Cohnella sp. YIM B05605]
MQSRFHPLFYVILPLAVLGFASQFETIWRSMLLPLAIIAVLFVLFLATQKRSFRPRVSRTSYRPASRPADRKPRPKSKTVPFKVIEGRKNRGDEEPPRYH